MSRPDWTVEVARLAAERLERRLIQEVSLLRGEMREGHTALRHEMREIESLHARALAALRDMLRQESARERFELLTWTVALSVAQLLVLGGLIVVLLQSG